METAQNYSALELDTIEWWVEVQVTVGAGEASRINFALCSAAAV